MGKGATDLINRIAGQRHGETFESEGYNDELFDAGAFLPPRRKRTGGEHYWSR